DVTLRAENYTTPWDATGSNPVPATRRRGPDPQGSGPLRISRLSVGVHLFQSAQRHHGVRISSAGAHLRRNPDRLHDLLVRGTLSRGLLGVADDAIGTLRHMGHRDGDQLLGLLVQRARGEDLLAERLERRGRVRHQFAPPARQLGGACRIGGIGHDLSFLSHPQAMPAAAPGCQDGTMAASAPLVAVCQFAPTASLESNRARVAELVAEAAARGARVVVLPEYSSFFTDPM